MTPTEFANWLFENASIQVEGDIPIGSVGSIEPTDNGATTLWYDTARRLIHFWSETAGAYRLFNSVPIGTVIDWAAAASASIPYPWLECDGSLLVREDYPELFEVIGTTWGNSTDATKFYLPDARGRLAVGADSANGGVGNYDPGEKNTGYTGTLDSRVAGSYYGWETIRRVPKGSNKPEALRDIDGNDVLKPATGTKIVGNAPPEFAVRKLIKYR